MLQFFFTLEEKKEFCKLSNVYRMYQTSHVSRYEFLNEFWINFIIKILLEADVITTFQFLTLNIVVVLITLD